MPSRSTCNTSEVKRDWISSQSPVHSCDASIATVSSSIIRTYAAVGTGILDTVCGCALDLEDGAADAVGVVEALAPMAAPVEGTAEVFPAVAGGGEGGGGDWSLDIIVLLRRN